MNPLPHPNQVRSACERCRKQKLKCSRPAAATASCSRCERLRLVCQAGAQRKVGRPARKEASGNEIPAAGSPDEILVPPDPGMSQMGSISENGREDLAFLQELPGVNAPEKFLSYMDWILPEDPGPMLNDVGVDALPQSSGGESLTTCTAPLGVLPPPMNDSAVIRITSGSQFSTLSTINKELHRLAERMSHQLEGISLESFVRVVLEPNDASASIAPYQTLMKLSQEYLQAIKSLHRSIGTDSMVVPRPQPRCMEDGDLALTLHPSLATPISGSSRDGASRSGSFSHQSLVLDSPTALLVISCFSQLLHYLETFFVISKARLDDPSDRLIPPAQETFAGVRVLEFLTQGAMFVEGLRNVLSQIILVLGFPTGTWWSGRTVWTGLLADTRYRDILNQELGSVEDGWSTRPARLMELIDACRAMIMDASMLGS